MIVEIEIKNWEKYNPRNDQKNYSWFRLNNDIGLNQELFRLSASQKFIWILLLCEASKKNSPKIFVDIEYIAVISKVSKNEILQVIDYIKKYGLACNDNTDPCNDHTDVCNHNPLRTNERTNERTNKYAQTEVCLSALEKIYEEYPRKLGRKKGLSSLAKTVRTQEELAKLRLAVSNYASHCSRESIPEKYMKHFSTFANCWEDFVKVEVKIEPRRII